jgi:hypothetical protein
MRRNRTYTRLLFVPITIVSVVWFKNHPAIRFAPSSVAAELTLSEMTANFLLASVVAMLVVLGLTSLGRAMGWWKE